MLVTASAVASVDLQTDVAAVVGKVMDVLAGDLAIDAVEVGQVVADVLETDAVACWVGVVAEEDSWVASMSVVGLAYTPAVFAGAEALAGDMVEGILVAEGLLAVAAVVVASVQLLVGCRMAGWECMHS